MRKDGRPIIGQYITHKEYNLNEGELAGKTFPFRGLGCTPQIAVR